MSEKDGLRFTCQFMFIDAVEYLIMETGIDLSTGVKTELQPYDGANILLLPHRQTCDEIAPEGDTLSDSRHSSLDNYNSYTSPLIQFWQCKKSGMETIHPGQ